MSAITRRAWMKNVGAGLAVCALDTLALRSPLHAAQVAAASGAHRFMTVAAGTFLMGSTQAEADQLAFQYGYDSSWLAGELPQQEIHLPAYAIDQYPVTNYQYARFTVATGHPAPSNWRGDVPQPDLLDHPVTMVKRSDAMAYAEWAGLRLPTEAEWEKAARGTDGRRFPWGDTFDPTACQWNPDPGSYGPGTASVMAHPHGASPYGVLDMVGNVAEWCADGPSPVTAFVKGGSWITGEILNLRPAGRNWSGWAASKSSYHGFRCVKELS